MIDDIRTIGAIAREVVQLHYMIVFQPKREVCQECLSRWPCLSRRLAEAVLAAEIAEATP